MAAAPVLGAGAADSAPPPEQPAEAPAGFVDSRAGALHEAHPGGSRPWSAVGFNDYHLTAAPGGFVCDGNAGGLDGEELGARLDRVRAAGGTAVRTWFFQSMWDPDADGSGEWAAFDRVIQAASERGLRVIPVLTNHWADCERSGRDKDAAYYSSGFARPAAGDALSFLDYAARVAGRYADERAIAYWQLANEPEAKLPDGTCDEPAGADALRAFAEAGAAAVRAAAPNHLISLGVMGSGQCGAAGPNYSLVQGPVDICELHVYDTPESGTSAADALPGDGTNGVAARIAACEAEGKPIIAGEVGFAADLNRAGARTGAVDDTTLSARAELAAARIGAMRAAGLDGFLLWQLTDEPPEPASIDPYGIAPADPLEDVVGAYAGA